MLRSCFLGIILRHNKPSVVPHCISGAIISVVWYYLTLRREARNNVFVYLKCRKILFCRLHTYNGIPQLKHNYPPLKVFMLLNIKAWTIIFNNHCDQNYKYKMNQDNIKYWARALCCSYHVFCKFNMPVSYSEAVHQIALLRFTFK